MSTGRPSGGYDRRPSGHSSSGSRSSATRSSSGARSGAGRSSSGSRSGSSRDYERSSRSSSGSRSSSSGDYERSYRSSSSRDYERRSSHGSSKKSGQKKRKMKSLFYFLCILGGYTLILLILAAIFLGYADRSLKKFEKSQSTYAMDKYVENFEKNLSAGTLPEGFASEHASAFESSDITLANLQAAAGGKTITYEKDAASYNTEEPIYDLLANGQEFGKVTLSATNSRVVFAILTIMDWDVKKAELTNVESGTVYTISAPADYKVMVNGVEVGSEYLTGKSVSLPLFANAKEYLSVPEIVEYKLPPLNNEPVVTALNENGEEAFVSRDGNAVSVSFGRATEMPEDLKETALEIAKTWSLFMTADLRGSKYGLDTVRQYLIPDSFYDGLAKDWAGGIDITFTSAHTLKSNPFENVEVSDYVRYTDDCFSCHISFDKPMHLTRTGEDIVDSTHSTYLFVKNNGQWCLVDMVADTDNADDGN